MSCGEFGTRWQELGRALGVDVVPLDYPWGETPRPEDLEARLRETGAGIAVLVHSETSTGVVCDLEAMLDACRSCGALSVIDAISSLGAVPLETDAWGADVVVTGSQKALMTPPGLSFVSISQRAWAKSAAAALPRFYWDWGPLRKAQAKGSTRFTPATSTVVALAEALRLVLADGLETAFARHVAIGRACRAGVKALGLDLYSPDEDRAAVLTAALTPPEVDAVALRLALRDRHGITIAGGHGDLVPRLFRIGHIGYVGIDQIATALHAIEQELAASVDVEPGAAVAAARAAYATAAVA
jgi:aspartate aminotransferase-like enzyme